MDLDDYLPLKDFADLIGVHVQTVRRWIYSGEIPSNNVIKVGGKWFIHRDVLDLKLKERETKTLFYLPSVNPQKLFSVYGQLMKNASLEEISEHLNLSVKRVYDYIRFLAKIGLIERRNGGYQTKNVFDSFMDFVSYVSEKLREKYSDLLDLISDKPVNYDSLSKFLASKGYDVSPTKIKNILSVLKSFNVIYPVRKIAVIEGENLEDKILGFIKVNGNSVKFSSLLKQFGSREKLNEAVVGLVRKGILNVKTIPRDFILISRAVLKARGRPFENIHLPIKSSMEIERLANALSELTGLSHSDAEYFIRRAAKIRPDLVDIRRDRPRPEHRASKPPDVVLVKGPITENDVLELVEV